MQSFSRHGIAKMLSRKESKSENEDRGRVQKNGASEEIRTLDINLGKVALYQLSYIRRDSSIGSRERNRQSEENGNSSPRCIPALDALLRGSKIDL